ncbi:MAG: GtrA family protein [Rhodobacterales bacterium]
MLSQSLRFGFVGGVATLVHISVGSFWIAFGINPLWANLWAFTTALLVSFLGHQFFTFRGHGRPIRSSAMRFASVAVLGFVVNEMVLLTLTKRLLLNPTLSLIISTLSVATMTFILSRLWAFRSV